MYKYKNPIDNLGMEKIKISRKNHNKLFPKRKLTFFSKYEYFINKKVFIMERYFNVLGKIVIAICLPFHILLSLKDIKEIMKEYLSFMNQKKSGSFSSDCVHSNSKLEEIRGLTIKE